MNNTRSRQIVTVINIKEIIWDLLGQWKAVFITALLMMVLVAGAKYAKDMKGYEEVQAEKNAGAQSQAPAEERIDEVLNELPDDERATVITMVKQNEWIESEKEYINDSILMNTDPANQRTLVADYYISADEDSESARTSLVYAYSAQLKDESSLKNIGKVIDPDADSKYIAELITVKNEDRLTASKSDVIEIQIVLPESADAGEVEAALTAELKGYTAELGSKICPHSIDILSTGVAYLYNKNAVDNRTNILYSIYNLQNNTKNMKSSLSDGQKTALESIMAIKTAARAASDIEEGSEESAGTKDGKPGISKKYALLGFVLGALMYAFIYLMLVIFKGRINNANDAEYYTQARLLGEVYSKEEHKGFKALLHSVFVDKLRYEGKLDEDEQLRKAASAVDVACKHARIDSVSCLCFSEPMKAAEKVIEAIQGKDIKISLMDISKESDEEYLLGLDNVVIISDNNSKIADVTAVVSRLAEYDVERIGTVYCKSI